VEHGIDSDRGIVGAIQLGGDGSLPSLMVARQQFVPLIPGEAIPAHHPATGARSA